jgi:hypothetical protein
MREPGIVGDDVRLTPAVRPITNSTERRVPRTTGLPDKTSDESTIRGFSDIVETLSVRIQMIRHSGVQSHRPAHRPVFTFVHSRLMIRCVAGSRAVMTNSFFSVASSG